MLFTQNYQNQSMLEETTVCQTLLFLRHSVESRHRVETSAVGVGTHYISPVGHEGVLTLTDPRGGHFFENCH